MSIEDRLRETLQPLTSTEPPPDVVDRATRQLPKRPNRRVTGSLATAMVLVALLAIVGLTVTSLRPLTPPGSSDAPDQTEPVAAGEATHAATPTESALMPTSLHPTQSPLAGTELERSDLYWDMVISGDGPDEIESLSGGFSGADLVVLGRFTEAAFEHDPALDELGDYPVAGATFTIEQVLKGQPETQVEGTIRLQFNPVTDTQLVEQLMPTHQHILFLFYTPSFVERLGRPLAEQEKYRFQYMLMHGGQAVIRNIGGVTRVLDPRNPDRFPNSFEGQPFDLTLETIQDGAPADEAVVEFTNPEGPDLADYPPDAYPFFETAYSLPTYARLWFDDNQRDVHIALTRDIQAAIEILRDEIPRGITVYFHIVEHKQDELCELRDAMFDDRDELMRHGIILSSGGCGNARNRVVVGISPLTPEAIAFMRARYDGPIDYEPGGASALRPFDPPEVGEVRLLALASDDLGLSTCGRRPFPDAATHSAPTSIDMDGPEFGALSEALDIYVEIYGDLSGLDWILAERDEYGATFIADRGDTWLEAPVYPGSAAWVPGTIEYCSPRALTAADGGTAGVYFDSAFPHPGADATEVHVLVHEQGCAGASSPAGRMFATVSIADNSVTLTVRVRGVGGASTCPGNPSLPVTIQLPEPLGDRELIGVTAPPEY